MSEHNDVTCADPHDVAAELALGVLTGRERAAAIAHPEKREANREDVRQLAATAVGLPPARAASSVRDPGT